MVSEKWYAWSLWLGGVRLVERVWGVGSGDWSWQGPSKETCPGGGGPDPREPSCKCGPSQSRLDKHQVQSEPSALRDCRST